MLKRILIMAAALVAATQLRAANTVDVGTASGATGSEVTVSVGLATGAPDVVAAEIRIPLPEGVEPDGCVKNAARLPDHMVRASRNGSDCVIVIFNTSLTPIPAGDGEALTLTLALGDNPGVFALTPAVKLSDSAGNILPASATGGTLTVLGARLALDETDVDFGRVPVRGTYTRSVTATNTGTTPLDIERVTTDVPGLTVTPAAATVAPGESTALELSYAPLERAASVAGRFTVYSNSVGRAPYVRVTSVPFSVNKLHTGSAEGVSDSEVRVALTMNNMEPIVGAEVSFVLPDELEYVAGSAEAAARAAGLTARGSVDADGRLRLVLFGLANKPVGGNDGELMSFALRLNGTSGSYRLDPVDVILSNAAGENMVSAVTAGTVTVSAPYFSGAGELNAGNVPLSGRHTFDYTVSNYGQAPLTIEKVVFLDDVARCDAEMPVTVAPGRSYTLPVTVNDPQFGEFRSTMNVYTNDPLHRLVAVAVSGKFYSANEMSFSGEMIGDRFRLTGSLSNEAEIVAMQLDIVTPDGITTAPDDLALLERAAGHTGTVAAVGKNRYRLVIFSLDNKPFTGSGGGVFTLDFAGSDMEGKRLRIENIKLSSRQGVNYTTPDSDIQFGDIPVMPREVLLSAYDITLEAGTTAVLEATVLPADATDRSVTWTTSDPAVATVDADGAVTGINGGSCTVTATAAGGVTAVCAVTVNGSTSVEDITADVDEETELYTLSGVKVTGSDPRPGVYVAVKNGVAVKVLIR